MLFLLPSHSRPPFATTRATNHTSVTECRCVVGYFDDGDAASGVGGGEPLCRECGIGVTCQAAGVTLASLLLQRGYWRPANSSLDILRCPDASQGNVSGCKGGAIGELCMPGLAGPFCRLCENATRDNGSVERHYISAQGEQAAHCVLCSAVILSKWHEASVASGVVLALVVTILLVRRYMTYVRAHAYLLSGVCKAKIGISFYQVSPLTPPAARCSCSRTKRG